MRLCSQFHVGVLKILKQEKDIFVQCNVINQYSLKKYTKT